MLCLNRVDEAIKEEPMDGALKEEPPFDLIPVSVIAETAHDPPSPDPPAHDPPSPDPPAHDPPAHEDPPDEPFLHPALFPRPHLVLCEGDIIGAKASIVYEDCLRQLATFLILPVKKCSVILNTGATCNCVAPFEVNVISKGTAMTVEWVSRDGHSISDL